MRNEKQEYIEALVMTAQGGSPEAKECAVKELLNLYTPLCKKTATTLVRYCHMTMEWEDVFQEARIQLLYLIRTYKNLKSSGFGAYVATYLYNHVKKIITRGVERNARLDIGFWENMDDFPQEHMIDSTMVTNYYEFELLYDDYFDFLTELKEKTYGKSVTAEIVIDQLFLSGKATASEISRKLGISPKAVKDVRDRIREDLKGFFFKNKFFSQTRDFF